jgi:hypothetical protein
LIFFTLFVLDLSFFLFSFFLSFFLIPFKFRMAFWSSKFVMYRECPKICHSYGNTLSTGNKVEKKRFFVFVFYLHKF